MEQSKEVLIEEEAEETSEEALHPDEVDSSAESQGEADSEEASEIEQLRAEAESARDRMLRAAAEFENYKKRAGREKNEFMKYVAEGFASDLLPVLDNLERAIASSDGEGSTESIRQGVEMIHKQLLGVLQNRGVKPIEAAGKMFDPEYHEAMAKLPSEEPENTVIQEYQRGYQLHERVIRPAKVVVSQGPVDQNEGDK